MAERRMLAKSIILSDVFLDMPATSRCLYFTLLIEADDDGFVNNPRSVMRQCGASDDDMKLLIAKSFVLIFETGVIVIKHWRIHNYIQKDRYTPTKCVKEKEKIELNDEKEYQCIQDVYKSDTQVSIGKDSIVKNNNIVVQECTTQKEKTNNFVKPTIEEVTQFIQENNYKVDANSFYDYYESNGWMVGRAKMKDWKACVRRWNSQSNTNTKSNATKRVVATPEWYGKEQNENQETGFEEDIDVTNFFNN